MSSDKHSLSKVQEPSLCILPTSSSWVLYSGRWAGACSPDREPAHSCHSGPQGLAASDLYKVAKLITLQAASRAAFLVMLLCIVRSPGVPVQGFCLGQDLLLLSVGSLGLSCSTQPSPTMCLFGCSSSCPRLLQSQPPAPGSLC